MDSLLFVALVIVVVLGIFTFALTMSVVAARESDRSWPADAVALAHQPEPESQGTSAVHG